MFTQTITLLLILSLQEGSQQFPVEMVKALLDRSDLTQKKNKTSSSLPQHSYQGTDKYLRRLNNSK